MRRRWGDGKQEKLREGVRLTAPPERERATLELAPLKGGIFTAINGEQA